MQVDTRIVSLALLFARHASVVTVSIVAIRSIRL